LSEWPNVLKYLRSGYKPSPVMNAQFNEMKALCNSLIGLIDGELQHETL